MLRWIQKKGVIVNARHGMHASGIGSLRIIVIKAMICRDRGLFMLETREMILIQTKQIRSLSKAAYNNLGRRKKALSRCKLENEENLRKLSDNRK